MIAEISAALGSVKVINDLVQANRSLGNFNEMSTAVYEANVKLMDAMARASTLMNENEAFKEENKKLKNWDAEREQYALVELRPGLFAHRRKPEIETSEPVHHLCTNCFGKYEKSILQLEMVLHTRSYRCLRCNTKINV